MMAATPHAKPTAAEGAPGTGVDAHQPLSEGTYPLPWLCPPHEAYGARMEHEG